MNIENLWSTGLEQDKPRGMGRVLAEYHNPYINKRFSLKLIERADLARFCRWMNDPRVEQFWQQAWSEEKQWQYLSDKLADAHTLPLVGYLNDQPFAYLEVYWAAKDRLAAHYDAAPYDRGIHLLVGEQSCRGAENFRGWMTSLSHLIYQSQPQTQRIVLEPRADNTRLMTRMAELGYHRQFEFDFPHKRAALLMGTRAHFYEQIFTAFGESKLPSGHLA
ncbi:GNAT family N-acetyltransferase [Pseudoalteromonas sp. OOF1S-7]|uniref:GNAT family N-acetyltransferase n=1 Tax=Pseudoalteromonas sp. OOF1S-7 TaxID=2917757 RepID=UPI001EF69471|nr:GNAT family N-acetyltransferase [Pseudoalteromonas sp. OOF1S-7]MCG7534633.1 acetyltransferase [Pseudoalteromonas sp. OOF1S-7]